MFEATKITTNGGVLEPMSATCHNGVCEVNPWNRKYTLSDSPFLSSIVSSGEEILAAPIRLVGIENDQPLEISGVRSDLLHPYTDDSISASQYMTSKRFLFNVAATFEEDGMMDWRLTMTTHGRTVAQSFGLGESDTKPRILSRLWLEIPIKKEVTKFYQFAPVGATVLINGEIPHSTPLALRSSGAMPSKSLSLPFLNQVFVGNDNIGFSVFFESDRFWQIEDKSRVIECLVQDDCVLMRIHLLDREPKEWYDKDTNNGQDLRPLFFRIGMQVTPVKQFPANPYKDHNFHIDCFKKLDNNYEEFFFSEFEKTGEMALDRVARLGVNVLYLHEKWNDMQNSPFLTVTAANRLKLLVEEAHKRGIKVIPYFGYELSTLSPIFAGKADEFLFGGINRYWWRVPWQRALRVCYNSGWKELFLEGLERLMDEFKFDGLYFDSIVTGSRCTNEKHGCGYRDFDGNLHGTYPIFACRDFMKRIYAIVHKRGGIVSTHSYGAFPMATAAYCDTFWEGESAQAEFMKGALDRAPEDFYRAIYSGRNIGVHVNMLCYSNPPIWTFNQALSNALPHGCIPKPVDTGEPLEIMGKIWSILDSYDVENAEWRPYFKNDVEVSDDNVRFSYYKNDSELLCFVANMIKAPAENVKVTLPCKVATVVDSELGEIIANECTSFTINVDSFDHKILKIKL